MQRTRLVEDTSDVEPVSTYVGDAADSGLARAHALQPPPKNAPADERKMWLDHQLDTLHSKTLLRQFVLLGPHQRRYGGAVTSVFRRVRHGAVAHFAGVRMYGPSVCDGHMYDWRW